MRDLNDKTTGSELTAIEFNEIPSEIQNVIERSGQALSSGDTAQLAKAIPINYANIAALRAVTSSTGLKIANVAGYYSDGDGGGGLFYWDATSTETDNGGTIIKATAVTTGRWKRGYAGNIRDSWFGNPSAGVINNLFLGQMHDRNNGVNIHRFADRVSIGDAASSSAGTSNKLDGASLIGDPSYNVNSFYLESSATLLSTSPVGGAGGSFGSRKSLRYSALGATLWTATTAISLGEKRGYGGKIYECTVAGTTSSTPPSHTSGTAVDGTVTWLFIEYVYGTAIGMATVVDNDISDGQGAWAGYFEMVRGSSGGTGYGFELVAKNKGSDITNTPYNEQPGGSTIGIWMAGGGDSVLGSPANPSTAAITVFKNAHTWNKGIVFGHDSITGTDGATGTGIAISMAKGHIIEWHASDGQGGRIYSDVTTTNSRVGITFTDDVVKFSGVGTTTLQVESVASSVNYVRLQAATTANGPNIVAGGSDTNIDLKLTPKGTGNIRFGSHTTLGAETLSGYITIKDSGGTARKIAVIS